LIPANRRREIRIHFAADLAVVETRVLQSLLHAFNQLIRLNERH
jgi:hypothetical protein